MGIETIMSRNLFFANLASGIILVTSCFFSQYRVFTYFALVVWGGFFAYLAKKDPTIYIKYFAFVFMIGAAVLGTLVIEFSRIYLTELECYSHFTGSIPLLLLSYWVLFMTFVAFERKRKISVISFDTRESSKSGYIKFINIATFVTLVLYLVIFSSVARRPAFLLGIDRFAYASQLNSNRLIGFLVNQSGTLLLFPLLAILYGKKSIGWLSLGVYFAYFLWTGNKFGPFFTALCILLLIFYTRIKNKGKRFSNKILKIAGVLLLGLVLATVIITSFLGDATNNYLFSRTAQQGQEWWRTYDICKGTMHIGDFTNEIDALFHGNDSIADNIGSQHGIYRIMYLTAPTARVDFKLSTGSRYTEAGFAAAYYYFGPIGCIVFAIIMGVVLASTLNSFIKAFNNRDVIKMLVLLRFFQLERTAISMFIFTDFIDPISVLSYIILLSTIGKNFVVSWEKHRLRIRLKRTSYRRIYG